MAKKELKKKENKKKDEPEVEVFSLDQTTKRRIWSIVFFSIAILILLAFFGSAGIFGDTLFNVGKAIFGVGFYITPLILIGFGVTLFKERPPRFMMIHSISLLVFVLSVLGFVHIVANSPEFGGYAGYALGFTLQKVFDTYGASVILASLGAISLTILVSGKELLQKIKNFFSFKSKEVNLEDIDPNPLPEELVTPEPIITQPLAQDPEPEVVMPVKKENKKKEDEFGVSPFVSSSYTPPPIEILAKDRGKVHYGDIKANSMIIKKTLENFGIIVEMDEVTVGPTVTRYTLKPAQGVRLAKIVALQNELALALAAPSVLIQAPIPGKSLVGIEIPNESKQILGLHDLIEAPEFQNNPNQLTIALGRDVAGRPHYVNIAKMPHMLIAGTTGSGKSVAIHTLITSLLYRNGPTDLRFIMVDPKRVELTLYHGIPHLLTPVITDPKKAILALKWGVKEMEKRYEILQGSGARDIRSYHELRTKKKGELEPMPYIVIIIDELADLMQSYPRELEAGIVRLAQMSRAVGIHLVLSTQRPDANVITGLIKANIPYRAAFKVASQINSRIIIDTTGAEKLLGAGDMLCTSENSDVERLQGPYISEEEVKKIAEYLRYLEDATPGEEVNLSGPISNPNENNLFSNNLEDGGDDDDLYEEARRFVVGAQKASTSYIQRKLKVGYSRAARLMDMLEERGVIGPQNGSKPRDVLEQSGKTEVPEEI